ncbi:unnamed protein product [Cyclocybe aegerita]|uniref:Uncharacterized protein n=1 Tax=Cyclocybe aegerita TaxID=1973307 RepID=A0A8S0WV62_CYCAE|nr:unnamed protein product [Cyclocybe aegerita]
MSSCVGVVGGAGSYKSDRTALRLSAQEHIRKITMDRKTNDIPATTVSSDAAPSFGTRIKGVAEVIHGASENLRGTMLGAVDTVGSHGGYSKNDEIARQGRLELERGLAHVKGKPAIQTAGGTTYDAPAASAGRAVPSHGRTDAAPNSSEYSHPNFAADKARETGLGSGSAMRQSGTTEQGAYGLGASGHTGEAFYESKHPEGRVSGKNPHVPGGISSDHPSLREVGAANQEIPTGAPEPQSTYPAHHRDDAITGVSQGQLNELKETNPEHLPILETGEVNTNQPQAYGTSGRSFLPGEVKKGQDFATAMTETVSGDTLPKQGSNGVEFGTRPAN